MGKPRHGNWDSSPRSRHATDDEGVGRERQGVEEKEADREKETERSREYGPKRPWFNPPRSVPSCSFTSCLQIPV